MLTQVLPNKYATKVYEGDVEDSELGLHRSDIESSGISQYDQVIVYSFGEKKPYLLRMTCYVIEVKKQIHSSFEIANQGYAVLSPESMDSLNIRVKGDIIVDPLIPREDVALLFKKARETLER
ncbi:MAG TPA: hypothetical protein ENH28_04755 [Euryarchaeota archaeon]|nr:hypothetical protein BMS3Bbin15_01503 [archaeon BMS3Bbin15]HDL15445.1 hypothetical protein [Euryarchaeota archaeon]